MPTETELALARKAMDEAREDFETVQTQLQELHTTKAKAFRAAEKAYKELCAQMEEA
jgi:phytoene/squalene synthetase